jgi:hypothetical protein
MTNTPRRTTKHLPLLLSVLGLLFLLAGVVTWWLVPPLNHTARTQLRVTLNPPNPLFPDKNPVDYDAFCRQQEYLIRDRFVLNAAIRKYPELEKTSILKDQTDPLQWLEKEIKVEFPVPEFMHISLTGEQPEEVTKIVTAVTESYLDNVVDREGRTRLHELSKLKQIYDEFLRRTKTKRERIRELQRRAGPIDEKNLVIQQQIDMEYLRDVKKELVQVHRELRDVRIELGIYPDWVKEVWPRYAACLNPLPGSSLPMTCAVVALLHDDTYLLHRAEQEQRWRKMMEKLRFLEEKKRVLLKEAWELDRMSQMTRREPADLVEAKEELAREEVVWQKAYERILKMELEQDVPARVMPTGERDYDGRPKVQAILYPADENKGEWMKIGAGVLAGLGLLLLALAAISSRVQSAHATEED